ncbi:ornithine decarboxylase antizyme-domain-containing protein [Fomes fomentarius]|nr:ornithine decarboxylase antizyme-domain-containing protein [Fomes fomentarius]
MSNLNYTNMSKQQSSICPTNGRQTVGDGAFTTDMTPSVIAVCRMEGTDSMYYYSTTFSGGPGVRVLLPGGFDIPTAKCPPDRGSLDWVTDNFTTRAYDYPPTPPPEESPELPLAQLPSSSVPRAIPEAHHLQKTAASGLATPPLTPDDGLEDGEGSLSALGAKQSAFLSMLFPRNALGAAPYAQSVSISTPDTGTTFDGVVLSLPGTPKTFYVDGKCAATVNLRESIVALLDLADEQLECNALIIALERSSPVLGDLLHSLMYVGGTVVTKPPFPVDPAYVLVGMEI